MSDPAPSCPVCEIHAESVFRVEGMDCHEEVAILERRLKPLKGLESMSADVVGGTLRVSHDAAQLSAAAIAEVVNSTGMRAWLDHDTASSIMVKSGRARAAFLVASGVTAAAGIGLDWSGAPPVVTGLVSALSVATGGWYWTRRAWSAARLFALDINTLMLIAVVGAIAIGEWSEAATVTFLFALAQWVESRSMERARLAIRALMELSPNEALVHRDGRDVRVPVDSVAVDDVLVVRPGEKFPLDGIVSSGRSDVNQAPITGESLQVSKGPGDEVFAGTINGHGALMVRVTHLRGDTTLARIINLVEHAQSERAPSQTFVERFARVYTPAVVALALAVAVLPPLLFAEPWSVWVYRALVFLVISCPCALVLSTPVSIVSALAGAAKKGVLIKGGRHLETLGRIRCVAFDKTGTLTHGTPAVVEVRALAPWTRADVLRLAASIESRSEHPIGRAIRRAARDEDIEVVFCAHYQALPGRGASAEVDGVPAVIGSRRLFEERGWYSADVDREAAGVAGADRYDRAGGGGRQGCRNRGCRRCHAPERTRGHWPPAARRHPAHRDADRRPREHRGAHRRGDGGDRGAGRSAPAGQARGDPRPQGRARYRGHGRRRRQRHAGPGRCRHRHRDGRRRQWRRPRDGRRDVDVG